MSNVSEIEENLVRFRRALPFKIENVLKLLNCVLHASLACKIKSLKYCNCWCLNTSKFAVFTNSSFNRIGTNSVRCSTNLRNSEIE